MPIERIEITEAPTKESPTFAKDYVVGVSVDDDEVVKFPIASLAPINFRFDCTSRTNPISAAVDNVYSWRVPFDMTVLSIVAELVDAASTGTFTIRIKKNGATIFTTNITIDAAEFSSLTAASQGAISQTDWNQNDLMTVDVTNAADGTASGLSLWVKVRMRISDLVPPSIPTGLAVVNDGSTEMDITWVASTDNVGVTGYVLQRALNGGFTLGVTNISLGNVTSYHDSGLESETEYFYRVKAQDAVGNLSAFSVSDSDTTGAFTPLDFTWRAFHDSEVLAFSNGADVIEYTDQTDNDSHMIPLGTQEAPIMVTSCTELNNKKAINFDNENVGLSATWNATGQSTVFIVGYFPTIVTSDFRILWGRTSDPTQYQLSLSSFDNTWALVQETVRRVNHPFTAGKYIIRIEHRATETRMFINGVDVTDDATSTQKLEATVKMGHFPLNGQGFFADTFIGIVACSDGLITGTDAELCEEFWGARYAITLP